MGRKLTYVITVIFFITLAAGRFVEMTPEDRELLQDIILEASLPLIEDEVMTTAVDRPADDASTTEPVFADEVEPDRPVVLYQVIRVIDGDTIVIDKDGVSETVRLIGIDTPETVHPSKAVQCFGLEASAKTKAWLEGGRVSIEIDPGEGERDKYRRLLGYVHRDDGLFVNLELIRQGYAYEYTYARPYRYQAEFKAAQAEAAAAKAGLWAEEDCGGDR